MRRRSLVVAIAALMVSGAVGCSSDEPARTGTSETSAAAVTTAPADSGADTAPESAFPVTIEHRLGSVTLDAAPQRIVALGNLDLDTLLALGVAPVGAVRNPATEDGKAPWSSDEPLLADTELFSTGEQLSFESLAALQPDLILASPVPAIDSLYPTLSQIAPTIADVDGVLADTWQDRTRLVGDALGRAADAEELVAETESAIATVRAEHPAIEGATYTLSAVAGVDQIRLMAVDDVTSELFADLGMVIPQRVLDLDTQGGGNAGAGSATLGLERLDLLDADLVMVGYASDDLRAGIETGDLFAAIPAVAEGRYEALSNEELVALRVPTVLGIPWLLDQLAPALEKLR